MTVSSLQLFPASKPSREKSSANSDWPFSFLMIREERVWAGITAQGFIHWLKHHRHHIKTQKDFLLSLVNQTWHFVVRKFGIKPSMVERKGTCTRHWWRGELVDRLVGVPTLTCCHVIWVRSRSLIEIAKRTLFCGAAGLWLIYINQCDALILHCVVADCWSPVIA